MEYRPSEELTDARTEELHDLIQVCEEKFWEYIPNMAKIQNKEQILEVLGMYPVIVRKKN